MTNSNQCTKKYKAEIRAWKNKVVSKSKTRIIAPNNKVNSDLDKTSLKLKAYSNLEVSLVPEKTSLSSEEVTLVLDIGIDLALK